MDIETAIAGLRSVVRCGLQGLQSDDENKEEFSYSEFRSQNEEALYVRGACRTQTLRIACFSVRVRGLALSVPHRERCICNDIV